MLGQAQGRCSDVQESLFGKLRECRFDHLGSSLLTWIAMVGVIAEHLSHEIRHLRKRRASTVYRDIFVFEELLNNLWVYLARLRDTNSDVCPRNGLELGLNRVDLGFTGNLLTCKGKDHLCSLRLDP